MKTIFASMAIALCSATAFAQESQPTSAPLESKALEPQPLSINTPAESNKKPLVSFAASLGGTLLGAGLVALSIDSFLDVNVDQGRALGVLGLVVLSTGPSAGHLYSGQLKHALVFSGARLATTGILLLGTKTAINGALDADVVKTVTGNGVAAIAGIALASFALYDVFDAPFSIKRDTQEILSWRVSPSPIVASNKNIVPGMIISTNF